MTMTEFLEQRIAEDEATPYELMPYACEPGCCAPAGWVGHRCLICQDGTSFGGTVGAMTEVADRHAEDVHRRSHTLAECKAKRAIIALVCLETSTLKPSPGWRGRFDRVKVLTPIEDMGGDLICHALASVYSDHPSYDPTWSPT